MRLKFLLTPFITLLLIATAPIAYVSAQNTYYKSNCCPSPLPNPQCVRIFGDIPANCADRIYYCETNNYRCTAADVLPGLDPTQNNVQEGAESTFDINIFNVSIRFNSDSAIAQIIFTAFSAFLAIAAIITVFKGVEAAIIRATADKEDAVTSANKALQNSIIGFALIILSLVIVQLVASFLGIGSITQITNIGRILPG